MEPIESTEHWAAIRRSGVGYVFNDSPPIPEVDTPPGILHAAGCRSLERSSRTSHRWKRYSQDLSAAEQWLRRNRGSEPDHWRRCAMCMPGIAQKGTPATGQSRHPEELIIQLTKRFADRFARTSASLQRLAYGEIHTFVRRYRADATQIASQYDRVEHLKPEVVLEFELGGGPRALGLWRPPVLTLLDVGGHDIVRRFERSVLLSQQRTAQEADGNFWPDSALIGGFFVSNPDRRISRFGNEADPEWVYFLTDQQGGIVASIAKAVARTTRANTRRYLIVGGPGTGKTSVLTKLLVQLRAEGRRPGLIVSNQVAKYVESGGAINLRDSRMFMNDLLTGNESSTAPAFDVALFDDPRGEGDIEAAFENARGRFRAVVIAFDPSQLASDMTDEDYDILVRVLDAKPYELRVCYRQKENVGRAAKRVMDHVAASTPFLRDDRKAQFRSSHEIVYRLSNELRYPNKYGYEQVYPKARVSDVRREIERVKQTPPWKHTPPVLLVVQRDTEASTWPWHTLLKGLPFTRVDLLREEYGDLTAVKGLEFQHAILAIGGNLFGELQDGFEGSGQARYHRRRLLRIPFSRAKDSMLTFVTADR